VFVEKYINNPRHIEIQVIADGEGSVLILGERECSIQRRHQKLIEESPSVAVDSDLRTRMFECVRKLVEDASYTNAGTVEFLLDSAGSFFFLEVNTRLQVEHPVTEMVTGLDLVELQLRVASGEPLGLTQDDVVFAGHAIECRICAEDPYDRFMPSVGRILALQEPEGEGVRIDSGMYEGMEVSLYYDPMIGKLITHGSSRGEAIDRMISAIDQYHIAGVRTTLPFCRQVLKETDFLDGNFSTGYVASHWIDSTPDLTPEDLLAAVTAAAGSRNEREKRRHRTDHS
jgi:acetyl/propionyl-CoA carboxylase alpha subunit